MSTQDWIQWAVIVLLLFMQIRDIVTFSVVSRSLMAAAAALIEHHQRIKKIEEARK